MLPYDFSFSSQDSLFPMNVFSASTPLSHQNNKQYSSARLKPLTFSLASKYFIDWLVSISCIMAAHYLESVKPYERYIIPDQTISYPFTSVEKIPPKWLPFIGMLFPSIIIIFITCYLHFSASFPTSRLSYKGKLLSKYHWSQFLHHNVLGLFMSVSTCYVTTNVIKLTCGRLRPDFISRCNPKSLVVFPIVCAGDQKIVADGRKSFPSGHTSTAFSGLSYIFFLLVTLFWGVSHSGCHHHNHSVILRIILTILPLMLASIIGITRLEDYRHHWQDVFVGAILGILFAYISFRQFHSNPFSRPKCKKTGQIEIIDNLSQDVEFGKY